MTQYMEPELLTIAELARNLDLPESTTRYYCNRFAEHLPSVGEGRRRRFKQEALDILKKIAETMRRDKNAYAVDLVLRNSADTPAPLPVAAAPREQLFAPAVTLAPQLISLVENQTKALQEIAGAMNLLAEKLTTLPTPPPAEPVAPPPIQESTPDDAVLHKEIVALREQIRASENVHQNDLEQLRKWLTRLGEALADK